MKLAFSLPKPVERQFYAHNIYFFEHFNTYIEELCENGVTVILVSEEEHQYQYKLKGTPSYSISLSDHDEWKTLNTIGLELDELKEEVDKYFTMKP